MLVNVDIVLYSQYENCVCVLKRLAQHEITEIKYCFISREAGNTYDNVLLKFYYTCVVRFTFQHVKKL